jgi:hypothetical protein
VLLQGYASRERAAWVSRSCVVFEEEFSGAFQQLAFI